MAGYFGVVDYFVCVITLLASLAVGIYFAVIDKRKRRNSPEDYFLAGRKSPTLPVALSFVVTFQSSLLILGFPVESYNYGMVFSLYAIGLAASYVFAGLVIVPVLYPLKVTSVNKYLHLRYGDNLVRYLAVFTQVFVTLLYMGSVIFGTCTAVEIVIGIPYWVTVLIYTFVTTVYTSIGGIKAVIWTDVFQIVVMFTGIVAVLIKSIVDVGGLGNVGTFAQNHFDIGDFSIDPTIRYTVWNVLFGSFVQSLYLCCSQSGIQRVNTTPSICSARLMYVISGPIYAIILFLVTIEGITIFAYFASKGCDILHGKVVKNVNQLVPFSVTQLYKDVPGINGLFIACLSSAALSTLSSCLSSLSAITYDDMIRAHFPDIQDDRATFLSKITVLIYGLIGMGLTFILAKLPGSIFGIFMGLVGCFYGPTTAIFIISVLFRRGTSKGVFFGSICGFVISLWIVLGGIFATLPPSEKLSPGPTYQCWQYLESSFTYNKSDSMLQSNITANNGLSIAINSSLLTSQNSTRSTEHLSLLDKIYSISYMLYALTGFLVSIIVSILVSLCTKPTKKVDDKYIFSFSKHILEDLMGKSKRREEAKCKELSEEEMKDLLDLNLTYDVHHRE